jgi:hypothetical protein
MSSRGRDASGAEAHDTRAMLSLLQQIVEHGAPAQAVRARELLAELARAPDSDEALRSARALVDAFLHDPHLTR